MRYDNPELVRQLAAEYVLGTLRGPARQRFEDLMHEQDETRFQVEFWEQRLAEFGQILTPVAPPPDARGRLLDRLAAPLVPLPARRSRPRSWLRRRRSRVVLAYIAGFGTAASLALALLLNRTAAPVAAPVAPSVALVEGLPIYAAQLRVPASSMGWLLSVSPDHQNLIAVAADDFLQLGRHRLHLWCLTPDAPPILIGELPVARDGSAQFAVPAAIRGRRDVSFAISLEPAQGPQNGAPAGPILNQSRALDVI